jgi:hypothetical protein
VAGRAGAKKSDWDPYTTPGTFCAAGDGTVSVFRKDEIVRVRKAPFTDELNRSVARGRIELAEQLEIWSPVFLSSDPEPVAS